MNGASGSGSTPIALVANEGEALWFLDSLVTIKLDGSATGGRHMLIEQLAPRGSGSPLHLHQREDEWFYVLEGEIAFWIDGRRINAPAGAFVFGPRGVPHTFLVTSTTARFLVGAEPAGFDDFVRELARPAKSRTLPPADLAKPSPEALQAAAARHGISILGPPGLPD
jgi:mannose-6-phosphate isomerase-like protein (cupin superfamily)